MNILFPVGMIGTLATAEENLPWEREAVALPKQTFGDAPGADRPAYYAECMQG